MNNILNEIHSILNQFEQYIIKLNPENASKFLELSELLIKSNEISFADKQFLHKWLLFTGKHNYISLLETEEQRYNWAEYACKIIQASDFSFNDLLRYRAEELSQKALFIDMGKSTPKRFSYEQVWQQSKEIATAIFKSVQGLPRLAIFCENSPESAMVDIAALAWDIPVSPLNVHFTKDELTSIFKMMNFNVVVTDTLDRIRQIEDISKNLLIKPIILHINESIKELTNHTYLPRYIKTISNKEIDLILNKRKRFSIDQVISVMFTSGSTGRPKGVSFSNYNIVSKRFCRAAALPSVGKNEVLLCYLPLFHTFGRYLEMTGMIYWGGTYVFVGNTSADNLLTLFSKVNPTGFISVPIRWIQIYDKIMEETENLTSRKEIKEKITSIVGKNLHWGLSAAGYLDPKIFSFFQKHDIELCSGFGMTEATGGITMTPPGRYVKGTVGKPLPGIYTKFAENNEMLISGHYVARYLDTHPIGSVIQFPSNLDDDYWLPTGDVFVVDSNGYFSIVDRVKDIYKNNKGQTISPKNVENKFDGVPGIKRTFLVGDGKAYNTLLIVPDYQDPLFNDENIKNNPRNYFQKIVTEANRNLAAYERVVNFEILERDFSIDFGELTPKGSYNRKSIEKNFSVIIDKLYSKDVNELFFDNLKIIIPKWFYRDLSILEEDIVVYNNGLINKETSLYLSIERISDNKIQIGDLIYEIEGNTIDIGSLALQPKYWIGNPNLFVFAPVKANFDHRNKLISTKVLCDFNNRNSYSDHLFTNIRGIRNNQLIEINKLICTIFYSDDNKALEELSKLSRIFNSFDEISLEIVRFRIQALAYHPNEEIRCLAYRTILQNDEIAETEKIFPAFLESGLTFLNNKSIEIIASSKFERRRLNALRKRLLFYRENLPWPQSETLHKQFESIFKLLVDFVKYNPEYYPTVRFELANWVLHKVDPQLSSIAAKYFWILSCEYENSLEEQKFSKFPSEWCNKIIFEDSLSEQEIQNIKRVLLDTTFLKQSITLAFEENDFDISEISDNGVWVSKISSITQNQIYRVSINTKQGKHYDLQTIINDNISDERNLETILWLVAVSGYPDGPGVLPSLGCARPELQARSMEFLGDLTVWEKLRQISTLKMFGQPFPKHNILKRLYIEGLSAFVRAWRYSGHKIIPGNVNPSNVVVPEIDFRDGATILSLAGWKYFDNHSSLIRPMIDNFYHKAIHHYSWIREFLDIKWIFNAFLEALGEDEAFTVLKNLLDELSQKDILFLGISLKQELVNYIDFINNNYYMPLPLIYAIDKYYEWQNSNPNAIPEAKEQSIIELYHLYRLDRYPEIARYQLYRHTYFAYKGFYVRNAFDKLLAQMNKEKNIPATQLIELSELQSTLDDPIDREIFSKMVFPGYTKSLQYDIAKFEEKQDLSLIVKTSFKDNFGDSYIFRQPIEPAEIGILYRLFYKEKLTKLISEQDQFLVLFDSNDRIIGGIIYQIKEDNSCTLDGIVLATQYRGRGLGRAMMEDFINRMYSQGIDIVKTTFYVEAFFSKFGFKVDKRWGLLVRILNKDKYLR